jgi:hypothetical protein
LALNIFALEHLFNLPILEIQWAISFTFTAKSASFSPIMKLNLNHVGQASSCFGLAILAG